MYYRAVTAYEVVIPGDHHAEWGGTYFLWKSEKQFFSFLRQSGTSHVSHIHVVLDGFVLVLHLAHLRGVHLFGWCLLSVRRTFVSTRGFDFFSCTAASVEDLLLALEATCASAVNDEITLRRKSFIVIRSASSISLKIMYAFTTQQSRK